MIMNRNNGNSQRNGHGDRVGSRMATGLGWFSIALGAVELLATRAITKALGMRGDHNLVRLYGVREMVTGVGILTSYDPAPWLWGRVAGDALDLGTLGVHFSDSNPKRDNVGIALANVAMIAALDVYCAQRLSRKSQQPVIFHDYSDRSGLPRPPEEMRGVARTSEMPGDRRNVEAFETHRDFDRNPRIK
jgi:hypothetical protein